MIRYLQIFLLVAIISSCTSSKKLAYMRGIVITDTASVIKDIKQTYSIKTGDLLYIRFVTNNKDINDLLNPFSQGSNNTSGISEQSSYFTNYLVDDSGYIDIPLIKKVKVGGETLAEARNIVEAKSLKYLNDVQVMMRFAQFKFMLLGEVKSPGSKIAFKERINILEAIAYGGDLNYYGKRNKIVVLRNNEKGYQTFIIDLTSPNLISSPNFYIQPNDVIYVEPLASTMFRQQAQDYTFILSIITSTLTMFLLIANLK